jgi:ribosomal 30S subunit maturation factor RimM
MKISDLVAIGRLGRQEPDGFHSVQFSQSYSNLFDQLSECFLIFNSHRVFFVTVADRKTTGKRLYYSFLEDGIAEECAKSSKILVALAPEDVAEQEKDDPVKGLFGYKVLYKNIEIGSVSDAMVNPMQSVLVIELNDGRELLVPNVETYVRSIDKKNRIIQMLNLDELLELCTSIS